MLVNCEIIVISGLAPLQTGFIFFQNIFFGEKEMPMQNGENYMKEQNESFWMVYGLPK